MTTSIKKAIDVTDFKKGEEDEMVHKSTRCFVAVPFKTSNAI